MLLEDSTKPIDTKWIGKPVDRTDGRAKVTGAAKYAADFQVEQVAHAVAFQSTIASGSVRRIDDAEASKAPGVIAVLTSKNTPKLHAVSMQHDPGRPGQTWMPMQDDVIHYAGQYLGLVVAETLSQALHAASLVKVEYDAQTPVTDLKAVLGQKYAPKTIGRGQPADKSRGDVQKALGDAAVRIDQTYRTPTQNHNPMESSATLAAWNGDHLTLYDATQWVYGVQAVVATWLGIDNKLVRVIDPYLGGGFGCKGSIWPHEVLAAQAAKVANRPVKLMLTRSQMFSGIGHRPETIQRVALAAGKDGKLTGLVHETTSQTSMWKELWVETAAKQSDMLYSCPNVTTSHRLAAYNANSPTQMRAPGHATGTFALEVAMDELAFELGIDPLELRLKNYAEEDEGEKKPFSSKALRECYTQASEKFGWPKRDPKPRSMRDGHLLIGFGMATATYPTNRSESKAMVALHPDGRAVVTVAAHDLGTGTYTILTQIAAESLGLPLEAVKVEIGDSSYPQAPVAGGSQTAASVGSAVKAACDKVKKDLVERATADPSSPLHQSEAKGIELGGNRIFLKSAPSTGEPIVTLLKRSGGRSIEATVGMGPNELKSASAAPEEDSNAKPKPKTPDDFSKHAWGAQFAEVSVDERLGEIRVRRFVGAFAAGRILNAKTAHSQVLGGIVWGISMALHERTVLDPRRGKIVNDNLADYLVPVNPDIPAIECFFVEEEDPHVNPLGVKGVGELGITGSVAAVVNAVYHATGKRIRDLPVTLDKLL